MGQYPLIGVSRWVICINRGCGKGEYGWMLIAVAISKSSREVLLLAMSITATEFQRVLDIIKVWRNEGFEALKIDGQYALCDRVVDPAIDYVVKYCCMPDNHTMVVLDVGTRGLAHAHTRIFFDELSVVQYASLRDLHSPHNL